MNKKGLWHEIIRGIAPYLLNDYSNNQFKNGKNRNPNFVFSSDSELYVCFDNVLDNVSLEDSGTTP